MTINLHFIQLSWGTCKQNIFISARCFGKCCGLNVYIPQNFCVEILSTSAMVLGDGACGRWSGHGGGALMVEGVPCRKRHESCFPSLCSLPGEDRATRQPLQRRMEEGSQQSPAMPAPWPQTAQAQICDEQTLLFKPRSLMVVCDSSLNHWDTEILHFAVSSPGEDDHV